MTLPKVERVREADAEQAIACLALAFGADVVTRAFYPDPLDHLKHFSEMMRINIEPAIGDGTAFYVEGFKAAAIWFPPAVDTDAQEAEKARGKRMGKLMEETIIKEGKDDLFAAVGQLFEAHPEAPHWYLMSIGVDPYHQNAGLGGVLMKHVLPRSDADGIFAYLESSNPRNVPFYERHGFEVTKVIQVGTSPTFTLMVREPR